MRMNWMRGLAALALVASCSLQAQALKPVQTVEGIAEYRLPNGLQVLLAPDDSKPTTTVNVTYRVGSRHENYGETGMAHLLEHLLFKGTPTTRNVWGEFTRRGLRANGTTWLDRTNYFASFTYNEENLRWYLSWQADAMVNSFIARRDLDTEMTVVRNEMEMGENSPGRILFERTIATMYQWHNYGKSTIGARSDVEGVDIGRLQAFYRTYYQPDNATLVVSGKFDAAKVLAWIQQDFGKIPRPKRKLQPLYTIDPVQDGDRSVTVRRIGGTPQLIAAYHVPPGPSPDTAAVELIGLVMADAPAGRLHRRLVDTGLAAGVWAWNMALADPGFQMFGAELGAGQDVEPARAALLDELEALPGRPITTEELERARAKWLKNWDLAFSNPEQVGVELSETVAQGDWRLFFLLRDRVRAVTLADVNRVAAERVLRDNRTLGVYVPTDKPVRAPAPARVDVAEQLKTFKPVTDFARAEAFDATPANLDARTQRFEIAPGLKVAVTPKGTRGNVVQATLALRLGDVDSLRGTGTQGEMLAAMLDKGGAGLTRQQIQDRITALKGDLSFGGDAEVLTARMQTTRDNLPAMIELAAQLMRQPALPADALEEVRRQAIAGLEAARMEPESVVDTALQRQGNPYPRGDVRYAATIDESKADLQAVTVESLREFHRKFVGASSAQFGAVGALDVPAVRAALEKGLGGWASATAPRQVPRPLVAVPPVRLQFETPDKQNAYFRADLSLPLRELDADQPALMVANFIVGAGGNSRLWKRIRETEGLSYDVRSYIQYNAHEPNSTWTATAIFAPQNRAKVEAAFREEIDRALKDGFTATEVAEARNGLMNFRRLSRAQDAGTAGAHVNNLYLGRTFAASQKLDEAIQKVTPEQAVAALRKYVDPAKLVIGVGGDFKGR